MFDVYLSIYLIKAAKSGGEYPPQMKDIVGRDMLFKSEKPSDHYERYDDSLEME